jgi:hypothetical protein
VGEFRRSAELHHLADEPLKILHGLNSSARHGKISLLKKCWHN